MRHRRSPTLSYPHGNTVPPTTTMGHPALALRYPHTPIPTLLSPLRFISNTPLLDGGDDNIDDFQSNAWVSAPSYRTPLAGLGITYLRDASPILDHGSLMQVDDDHIQPFLADDTVISPDNFSHSIEPYHASNSNEGSVRIVPTFCEVPTGRMDLDLDGDVDSTASDMVGLIPDVNMYDRLRRLDVAHPGVNPLDTICSASPHDISLSYGEPFSSKPEDHYLDDAISVTDPKIEQSPSPRVIQDIMSILIQPAPELPSPSSPAYSPSIQGLSPSAAPWPSVRSKLEHAHVPETGRRSLSSVENTDAAHSSPVLNAHLGIELDELVSRAERFRTKHPEQEIDRAWLSHFAGKLSDRGELLNDFRCYVNGCDQRNKRRDHILVHVGAHIGQRPFACSICPLRFLRKNECKRHEASHSGFRPYSCDICGQTFVRQDLVKRHVKRTHGAKDENQPGVAKQSRRKTSRLR